MSRLSVLLSLSLLLAPALAINCPGCTPLDSLTFNKLTQAFPASLVKFDVAYPYGEEHDEFAKVAKDAAEVGSLFIGEVGVKDYAEKDNQELADQFSITKDDFPAAILFRPGPAGQLEQFRFPGKLKADELKSFVKEKVGIHLPMPGCLEEFDELALQLVVASKEEQQKLITQAETLASKVEGEKQKRRAAVYVRVMKRVAAEGESWADKEGERVSGILAASTSKITPDKKEEMQERLNILRSFRQSSGAKQEL